MRLEGVLTETYTWMLKLNATVGAEDSVEGLWTWLGSKVKGSAWAMAKLGALIESSKKWTSACTRT